MSTSKNPMAGYPDLSREKHIHSFYIKIVGCILFLVFVLFSVPLMLASGIDRELEAIKQTYSLEMGNNIWDFEHGALERDLETIVGHPLIKGGVVFGPDRDFLFSKGYILSDDDVVPGGVSLEKTNSSNVPTNLYFYEFDLLFTDTDETKHKIGTAILFYEADIYSATAWQQILPW